ncbi:hypothetical protein GFV14_00306 [Candidatus Hartigia pinicola]|nr:hypothetical protein GFV14_00306 [Candidatus Hartigia pinicola]
MSTLNNLETVFYFQYLEYAQQLVSTLFTLILL